MNLEELKMKIGMVDEQVASDRGGGTQPATTGGGGYPQKEVLSFHYSVGLPGVDLCPFVTPPFFLDTCYCTIPFVAVSQAS